MERYIALVGAALAVAAFIPAFIFFFRAATNFVQMQSQYQSGRHNNLANLLPILSPFMPELFTEQGNIHRHKVLINFGGFLCCVAFIVFVFFVLGIKS